MYFYTSAALNAATNYAARQIRIGAVANNSQTLSQFQTTTLCPQLPSTMSCSNVVVNVYDVPEGSIFQGTGFAHYLNGSLNGIAQPSPMQSTTFCPGGPAATIPGVTSNYAIYVQAYYAMPIFSPIWLAVASQVWSPSGASGGSNVHFVPASAAFKNEPYVVNPKAQATC